MRKTGNKSFAISAVYLVITLILCTGIIFYTNNGGTGKTFADITDTMPDTGSDEIVAGEEEVPLGQAPKVTVKTSKKTTTKKKKLKKASKKTKKKPQSRYFQTCAKGIPLCVKTSNSKRRKPLRLPVIQRRRSFPLWRILQSSSRIKR